MLNSIIIKNFRGLQAVKLEKLANINIIVGDNGSGKTSLLEAIYIATLNMDSLFISQLVNLENVRMGQLPINYNDGHFFMDIFYHFNIKEEILLESAFSSEKARLVIKKSEDLSLLSSPQVNQIQFNLTINDKKNINFSPVISPLPMGLQNNFFNLAGVGFQATNPTDNFSFSFDRFYYAANSLLDHMNAANKFSNLPTHEKEDIKNFFELEVLDYRNLGNVNVLCGVPKGKSWSKSQPLHLLSLGLTKMIQIAIIALSLKENSIMLIDEGDNGIFYERYKDFWKYIKKIVEEKKIQFFITTHSKEFVEAALPIMQETDDKNKMFKEIVMQDDKNNMFKEIVMQANKAFVRSEAVLESYLETKEEIRK